VQIVGVAPVGASNLRSVAVAVAEARPGAPPISGPAVASPAHLAAEQRLVVEIVALPSERARVDARPEELRRRIVSARYRENGGEADDSESRSGTTGPGARGRPPVSGSRGGARWA